MIIFPDLPDIQVEEVEVAEEITLILRTTSPTASCPSCGTNLHASKVAIHGHCEIFPPLGVQSVSSCMYVVFSVKRAPVLKRSLSNDFPISAILMRNAPNGCKKRSVNWDSDRRPGRSRYGKEHGISGSRDTILRLVRQSKQPAQSEPHVIGLDDWAWKRRLRYGTLICDLEQGLPIDLLPDRTVETVSAWLQKHPSIEIVSRDGSSEYASAIKKGAPQARQVSDRWHLVKNLAACVSVQLAQSFAQLRRAEAAAAAQEEQEEQCSQKQQGHPRTRAEKHAQQVRQAERKLVISRSRHLQKQGMKSAEIAAQWAWHERTVRQWFSQWRHPLFSPT